MKKKKIVRITHTELIDEDLIDLGIKTQKKTALHVLWKTIVTLTP